MNMTPEQALENLDKIAAAHRGDRATHRALEQSVQTLAAVLRELALLKSRAEGADKTIDGAT